VVTCNAAISTCEKSQQRQQASHLLRAMRRQAIVLNVTTYDAAISAWEKGRQRQQVLHPL